MPRTINAVIEAIKSKQQNIPIELYRVFLDEQTLYLAMYPQSIDFFDENNGSKTYIAAALSRSAISTNIDMQVDMTTVTIDNVTKEMSAYVASTEFRGRKMEIIKIFLDDYSSPEDGVLLFSGTMDEPALTEQTMTVSVVGELDTLNKKLPGRSFSTQCTWLDGFGGEACGFNVPVKSGVIDRVGDDNLTINDANITEEANYWKYGYIRVGNERRYIQESGAGYVRIDYPFSSEVASQSYSLHAGCDKTYDGGHGCSFWGNTKYYGGFLSIPKNSDVREFN